MGQNPDPYYQEMHRRFHEERPNRSCRTVKGLLVQSMRDFA